MHVLIAHRSAIFTDGLTDRVRSWGHAAEPCHDAITAVRLMRNSTFDLALLDVGLTGGPGEQVIASVKAQQPDIKIVALSDSTSRKLQTRIREKGIIYYMLVPSEITHLKPILDHLSARAIPAAACPPLHRLWSFPRLGNRRFRRLGINTSHALKSDEFSALGSNWAEPCSC